MSCPIARPIAQSPRRGNACFGATFAHVSARHDSAAAPSKYITAVRLAQIASDLTPRDGEVLNFLSACRLATGKQLVCHFWTDDPEHDAPAARAGRRAIKRLSDWRVLDPLPGRTRGGVRGGSSTLVYKVGVAGEKLLAQRGLQQRRLGAPGERFIAHTLTVTQLAIDLHAADTRGALELIALETEPTCWRPFLATMGARAILKPDLFVRVGVGALEGSRSLQEDRWFIECDLGSEHTATLLVKAKRYVAHYRSGVEQREHGTYPRVLWAVPDQDRARQVEAVVCRLPAQLQPMFAVCLLGEVAARLAAEARS